MHAAMIKQRPSIKEIGQRAMVKQILTRPDFDGIVCAVLLKAALGGDLPVQWVQPNEIQNGTATIGPHDVVANLPLIGTCAIWFDHHVSNEISEPFEGIFRIAPSAAGLVSEYYQDQLGDCFQELVRQADKIDSAQLSLDEILCPECYPYVLLSMTVHSETASDLDYCNHLVSLLGRAGIDDVLADDAVRRRCTRAIEANRTYQTHLKNNTTVQGRISISDFRGISPVPDGNRFLVYSLFPETIANIKIFDEGAQTAIKLGHSILNRGCRVNVGRLLARYGGGGHFGAGACRIPREQSKTSLAEIIQTMVANAPEPD
jgi:hypothetical protein